VLLKGGNAFDAAVAVGAMIALGGGDERHRWKRFVTLFDGKRQSDR
jgi:hypothetical protein